VVSPFTADAFQAAEQGEPDRVDGVAAYARAKVALYSEPCRRVAVDFQPFVVSAFGRPSATAGRLIKSISRVGQRRLPAEDADSDELAGPSVWWRGVSVLLARRLSRMYDACKPSGPSSDDGERVGVAVLHGGLREDFLLHDGDPDVAASLALSGGDGVRGPRDLAPHAGAFA